MKLSIIFLIVFITGVLGLDEASETVLSIEADEETMDNVVVEDSSSFWLDMNALSKEDHGNVRTLGSCNSCNKKHLYYTGTTCPPEYQNPAMHRNFKTQNGCDYTCCTDIENDPNCCRVGCDYQCAAKYVLNNGCRVGYKRNMVHWGSYEIGPNGPYGYRKTPTKDYLFTNARCYYGCCADTTAMDKTTCCVKA